VQRLTGDEVRERVASFRHHELGDVPVKRA
jgi:hypothetical protein